MEVRPVGQSPAFKGYLDKSVIKMVDKTVKATMDMLIESSSDKMVSSETLQSIAKRGQAIKKDLYSLVKDGHADTKLSCQKGILSHSQADYYDFSYSNDLMENARFNIFLRENKERVAKATVKEPLHELEDMERLSKALLSESKASNVKTADHSLFEQFLTEICAYVNQYPSGVRRWINDLRFSKAKKLANDFGHDKADVTARYNDAIEFGKQKKLRIREAKNLLNVSEKFDINSHK